MADLGGTRPKGLKAFAGLDPIQQAAAGELLEKVVSSVHIQDSGQSNDGFSDPRVTDRQWSGFLLESLVGLDAMNAALEESIGRVPITIRSDRKLLRESEKQPLDPNAPFDFRWAKNQNSSPRALDAVSRARRARAELAAKQATSPAFAYDASDNCLLAPLFTGDSDARARILADALLQFRAKRRTKRVIDREGTSTGSEKIAASTKEGRIATSGTIASAELRLACQEAKIGGDFAGRREYALTRLGALSHPFTSVVGIFHARNLVSEVMARLSERSMRELPETETDGELAWLYNQIHKNYSADTPRSVEAFIRDRVFTGGPEKDRVQVLAHLVGAAGKKDLPSAIRALDTLKDSLGYEVPGARSSKDVAALSKAILDHIAERSALPKLALLSTIEETIREGRTSRTEIPRLAALEAAVALYEVVVKTRPSVERLARELGLASAARPEVERFVAAMGTDDVAAQIESLRLAREALRRAAEKAETGFERLMIWRVDSQLERISAELFGSVVEAFQAKRDAKALPLVFLAAKAAISGVLASGLETVRDTEKRTARCGRLESLERRMNALAEQRRPKAEDLRDFFADLYASSSEVAESIFGFFTRRAKAIHFGGVDVETDHDFTDNLVKETPLHYLLALAQAGMGYGLASEVSATAIRYVEGMRVLSSTGPTVYKRVLIADTFDDLLRFHPKEDDFCIVHELDEKSLVAVGGLLTDTKSAPGGYSHISVFAKGHAISAIALPELKTRYAEFFANVKDGGGLYVDDRNGRFVMMPLGEAIRTGVIAEADVERLRPGHNTKTKYFDVVDGKRVLLKEHEKVVSDSRPTKDVELLIPKLEKAEGAPPFLGLEELGRLSMDEARQLAGEKGAVQAKLAVSKAIADLGAKVPEGGSIPPYEVVDLMRLAKDGDRSLLESWYDAIDRGATGGPDGWLSRKLFLDPEYLRSTADAMKPKTLKGIGGVLMKGRFPTDRGKELLAKVRRVLGTRSLWIARSSFITEDRPNKTGAGQHDSFPLLGDAKRYRGLKPGEALLAHGLPGVVASAWNVRALYNSAQLQIDLTHNIPAVLVQRNLKESVSGVASSRGPNGELGQVGYQVVPGAGSGVDRSAREFAAGRRSKRKSLPEEGVLTSEGAKVHQTYDGAKKSLLTPEQQEQLRKVILAIEREFDQTIEPGKGYSVEVEWGIERGQLYIKQARVLSTD
jgi:hypothetical protein